MVSKLHLLFLSTLGVLLFSMPAEAAKLLGWQFDSEQNRLEFTTDGTVAPRAQLIFNPTRVVVDLPGTRLEQPLVKEALGGNIRAYRIGQFDAQTARIVIEIAPGYSLDPDRVKVRGLSSRQWMVELPEPERVTSPQGTPPVAAQPGNSGFGSGGGSGSGSSLAQAAPLPGAATQVRGVRSTPDGLFVTLGGEPPKVKLKRSRDRRNIDIEIGNSTLASAQIPVPQDLGKLGIAQIALEQTDSQPPTTRIRLTIDQDAPDWKATVSNFGGIVLLPTSRPKAVANGTASASVAGNAPVSQAPAAQVARVQAISLDRSSNQLLLQVDQPARYSTRQEGSELVLTLSPAQLLPGVSAPPIYVGDRLRRVTVQQRGPQSVEVRLTPDQGVTIGEVQVPNLRLLSLPLQRSRTASGSSGGAIASSGNSGNATTGSITVTLPPGGPPTAPTAPIYSPDINLPNLGNRRAVVVIDPGHGGPDPGAVGNGLKETEIVLDISRQVTGFLEAQGVQVIMTRNGEYDLDLQPRVDIAERANATLFVSIHANAISLSRPDVNGVETYYYSASGKALADTIHRSILESISMDNRGVKQARFYVLRRTSMPAVLVETGFITGGRDKFKLADPSFRTQMARAIAQGILRHLQ